jgi:hypothetical protein
MAMKKGKKLKASYDGRFFSHQVDELYVAMRTFEEIMNEPDNHIKFKLRPGQIICLRNEVGA